MRRDGLRSIIFQPRAWGYDPEEVEAYLSRVADSLDAGHGVPRPPRFLPTSGKNMYDVEGVDWFLNRLQSRAKSLVGKPGEPWSWPVANYSVWPSNDPPPTSYYEVKSYLAREYDEEWRRFPDLPGTHLLWTATGLDRRELQTPSGDVIAIITQRLGRSGPYGVSRVETQNGRHEVRRLGTRRDREPGCELVDTSGRVLLRLTGRNVLWRAQAKILSWPQGILRFPVRGSRRSNGVMTAAIWGSGWRIAKFRPQTRPPGVAAILMPPPIDVVVHPTIALSPQVVAMAAMTAPFVRTFFDVPWSRTEIVA